MRKSIWMAATAALLAGAFFHPAHADVITMENGDRITAEVKRIWDNELYIEPEYGDEFSVDLDAVASIDSERNFEIELYDDTEIFGQLSVDQEGQPILVIESEVRPLSPMSIEELDEPEEYFEWEVLSDVSVNVNNGNANNADFLLQADGSVKFGDRRHGLKFAFERQTQLNDVTGEEETTKEQDSIEYAYSWFFRDPWFLNLNIGWETDPIRDLSRRTTPGIGIGYQLWDDASRDLEFVFGADAVFEVIGGEETESLAPRISSRFSYKFMGGDLTVFNNLDVWTYTSGRPNDVFNSSSGIRYDITDDIYVNIQYDLDRESNPAEGASKTDTTYVLGIGVKLD